MATPSSSNHCPAEFGVADAEVLASGNNNDLNRNGLYNDRQVNAIVHNILLGGGDGKGLNPPANLTDEENENANSVVGGGGSDSAGANPVKPTYSQAHAVLLLTAVFLGSVIIMGWVYNTFPNMEPQEKKYMKLPRNMEDAKQLGGVLNTYKEKYYFNVLAGVFVVYIFLQTFAIPGSIFLSILSGFLFPFWLALLLICFCSATGASFCYGLSLLVGRRLMDKYFPERVMKWQTSVEDQRSNLMNYIIFLRITPFLPNWFINITSPIVGVPLLPFWIGTFIGVAPPSFVAIQAGTTLHQLSSSSDALSWVSLSVLLVLGVVSLIPVLFKDKLKKKFD